MADPSHAEVEAALAILAAAEAARAAEALRAAEAAAAPAVAAPTIEPVVDVTPPIVIHVAPPIVLDVTPPVVVAASPFAARIATLNEFAAIYMAYTPLPNVSGFENDALARAFDRQQVNALTIVLSR